jgi:ribosomal protein S18 acetylase RimI-like enzyme
VSGPTAFEVRPLRSEEAARVADLHLLAFPDYESSRLGRGYCRRLVLAYGARSDSWVSVAVAPGGPIEGFLVGAPPAAQREVNASLVVPWGLLGALRSPGRLLGRLPRAWSRLRRGRRGPTAPVDAGAAPAPNPGEPSAPATIRVVLVGVDPAARGRGAADALLGAFAERARSAGHEVADLSVAAGNAAARRVYARNGWQEVGVEGDGVAVRCRLDLTASGRA